MVNSSVSEHFSEERNISIFRYMFVSTIPVVIIMLALSALFVVLGVTDAISAPTKSPYGLLGAAMIPAVVSIMFWVLMSLSPALRLRRARKNPELDASARLLLWIDEVPLSLFVSSSWDFPDDEVLAVIYGAIYPHRQELSAQEHLRLALRLHESLRGPAFTPQVVIALLEAGHLDSDFQIRRK